MRKNSHTPSAQTGLTSGTARDTSRPHARPRVSSTPSRCIKGDFLKQMPLRIEINITRAVKKKAVADLIKNADRSSVSKGKPIDFSGRDAQRDSMAAYPASNAQSESRNASGPKNKRLKAEHNGM